MCGIVGYIGGRQATPILVNGLRRLEYRGYDSAGVAVWDQGESRVVRCRGKLAGLESLLGGAAGARHARHRAHALGHPRPAVRRERPPAQGRPASRVVHNGIIENHVALRDELMARGQQVLVARPTPRSSPTSSTPSWPPGRPTSPRPCAARSPRVKGAYAIVVLNDKDPTRLVAAKNASPLVVGLRRGRELRRLRRPRDPRPHPRDDLPRRGRDRHHHARRRHASSTSPASARADAASTIDWSAMQAEKGGFKHFMLKEIHEQPRAVADTLGGRIDFAATTTSTLDGIDARRRAGCRARGHASPAAPPTTPRWSASS